MIAGLLNKPTALILVSMTLVSIACSNNSAIKGNVFYYGNPQITEQIEINTVWAANRVWFDFQTIGDLQFVSYYDKDRMMTIASRKLGSSQWTRTRLSSKLHWDSHNYVVMGIDEKRYIHVSGNMHVNPLVYYRSAKPLDISSMIEVHRMTGENEDQVTYPKFFNDREGKLLFSYRSGTCGNGDILVKRFDTETMSWSNYFDIPLFEGIDDHSDRAAYHSCITDTEGNFHFMWMWRWTPMVETCHQLCYAKTPDLHSWENAFGQPVRLPHHPDDEAVIVDDTPSKGGMHNSRRQIIIDKDNKPILGYVKYDEKGFTQLYLAKPAENHWMIKKLSDWKIRWKFIGGGDLMAPEALFRLEGFSDEGYLVVSWETTKDQGLYVVDPATFELTDTPVKMRRGMPVSLDEKLTDKPELKVRTRSSRGTLSQPDELYVLKWETMSGSHGKHAPQVIPTEPTSKLLLLKIEDKE